VDRGSKLKGPMLAAATWLALALAELWLRDTGRAMLLVWLPSAVAVAALHATARRHWPEMLAALAVAQVAMALMIGFSLVAGLGYAAASAVEAVLCTWIGRRVVGGRGRMPTSLRHIAGLFGAALAGSAAGALIVYPFRPAEGLPELAWWFLASVLGILVGVPVLLYIRQRLGLGNQRVQFRDDQGRRGLALVTTAMFVTAVVVLQLSTLPLLWLLMAILVVAVVRHGQFGGALGVLAITAAATLDSLGGRSPAAFLDLPPEQARLVLQAMMLAMLAVSLPIAAMLLTRNRLEACLREQNAALHESLTTLRLAERLAGIGCWHYDIRSGRQHWSELMLEINGLPRELAPDPGNLRELLPDGGDALFSQIARQRDNREPYSFEYSIRPPAGPERVLRMVVTNEFNEGNQRIALFAVAMDVTEQARREEALELARERAVVLAAEAQKLAMTDALTGLANRRCTLDWLKRSLRVSNGDGSPLALVMFDIDHFKAINDCFGHPTGDAVLVRVAELARREIREEDLIGRIGGEEFVWLLPGVGPPRARDLAERLRDSIEHGSAEGDLPRVTVSVGLAHFRAGDTSDKLLARADAALYVAKEGGRNKVHRAA
jgi:diguanylate cyclase (GGDEF)-like protein